MFYILEEGETALALEEHQRRHFEGIRFKLSFQKYIGCYLHHKQLLKYDKKYV